ncbi:MAG: response regulator, partial [Planctomycetota bacterium]
MNGTGTNSPPCILLVDDDGDWRTVVRDALVALWAAADIREVSDAPTAMEYLHRRGEFADAPRPDVIYLDVEMPGVSGHELLKQIKSDPDLQDIPVVIVTGLGENEQAKLAARNGADGFVVKSSEPGELLERMRSSMDQWAPQVAELNTPSVLNAEETSPDAKDAERRIRHPKILIVEDDADQQQLISEVLCIHFND